MNIKIGWLYHDIMNLYGDRGNMMVLQQRCQKRGIDVEIKTFGIGEHAQLEQMDFIFFGGGADREQSILMADLLHKKDALTCAMEQGCMFLLICGGYQLFGKYYVDAKGNQIDGLGFFDYYTLAGTNTKRCVGNVAVEVNLDTISCTLIGFENHGGQTFGVSTPLGKVLYGYGNNVQDKQEGYFDSQVIGTYLHGPLLPRNPELADYLIAKCLKKKYGDIQLVPLDDAMELAAKRVMLKRMNLLNS